MIDKLLHRITAGAAAPLLAALVVGVAGMHAQPAVAHAEQAPAAPNVGYEAKLVGDKIITTLTSGTFEVSGDSVGVKDEAGETLITMPLAFRQDGMEYPLPHTVSDEGRVLELTAVKDTTKARRTAQPVASIYENRQAQDSFMTQFGIATAIGGFIGTALGALVGLTGIVTGPGVIASVIAGATIGGIIGTIVAGGPTLIVAGVDLLSTLTAAPGTTKWMESDRPEN
ncbi:ammonium transporter [Nocardia callitridis]|uniref:DUF8020 domain-containing protein n=1 Tax=Nocardia callitridis TaxID=648753 RepID=A0ABP9KYF8_9NOCA